MLPAAFVAPHDRVLSPLEHAALHARRSALLSHAAGTVLDLGGGAGEHLLAYPATVERVDVVGPDPLLAPVLRRRMKGAAVAVRELPGGLDAVVGPYRTVVAQFVLCAVPDLAAVLGRLLTLLHPDDGVLLFCEHRPARPGGSLVTTAARPLWRRVAAGCDITVDVPAALRARGFAITSIERFTMPTLQLPVRACASGVARPRRLDVQEVAR